MAQTRKQQEIWESTTGGQAWINVRDPRNPDGWTQKSVGGRGTKRITLTVEEREFNQELVAYENEHLDPFTNGMLVRISPSDTVRGKNELTDDDLAGVLRIEDDERFTSEVNAIDSEINMRRLLTLAEKHTSKMRYEEIQAVVDQRYAVGKTSRVVKEIYEDESRYAGADI